MIFNGTVIGNPIVRMSLFVINIYVPYSYVYRSTYPAALNGALNSVGTSFPGRGTCQVNKLPQFITHVVICMIPPAPHLKPDSLLLCECFDTIVVVYFVLLL